KILSLIPENQHRIYKAIWGMDIDEEDKLDLDHYIKKYHIPDADWDGWKPEFSLEDIKVNVVRDEDLALMDFNYWNDDIERANLSPELDKAFDSPSFRGFNEVSENIREVMEGQGLRGVSVTVQPSNSDETNTRINYKEDRSKEIEDEFKFYMDQYI